MNQETDQTLLVPAWWLKRRNLVIAGLLGTKPGWLAIGVDAVAFATGGELIFAQSRSDVRARVKWLEILDLTTPAGFYRFHLMRPTNTPYPDGTGAATAIDMMRTATGAFGPPGLAGQLFGGLEVIDNASEFLGGVSDYRSSRRNARLVMELLGPRLGGAG
jgi:hypothetical protein